MKYKIEKRQDKNSGYSLTTWPWQLTYPDGTKCLCFSQRSAVETMNDQLRGLKSQRSQFVHSLRKYFPGTVVILK